LVGSLKNSMALWVLPTIQATSCSRQIAISGRREGMSIRHYGLLASASRRTNLAHARELLEVAAPPDEAVPEEPVDPRPPCTCCGGHMIIIETFDRWRQPQAPPSSSLAPPEIES
jgi:hypothetical protein